MAVCKGRKANGQIKKGYSLSKKKGVIKTNKKRKRTKAKK